MKKYLFVFCICLLVMGCKKKYVLIFPTVSVQQIASPVTEDLQSICFISSSNGFIGGSKGNIYKTNNGGSSWTNISLSDKTMNVEKVLFISALKGFCATQQDVFRTIDGGTTWVSVLNSQDNIFDIQFVTATIGYAVGGQYTQAVYKTTDGGTTWNNIYAPPGFDNPMNAVSFINKDTGYATVSDKRILETVNGGIKWTQYKNDENYIYNISDLVYTGYRTGYAVGQYGYAVYQNTSDHSTDVNLISKDQYGYNINAIAYRNGHIVAVGAKSILMPYNDPESKSYPWHYYISQDGTTLPYTYNDVTFSDDFTFYAVGNGGVITKFIYPNQ